MQKNVKHPHMMHVLMAFRFRVTRYLVVGMTYVVDVVCSRFHSLIGFESVSELFVLEGGSWNGLEFKLHMKLKKP